jgi:hypothetical protein
VLIDPEYDEMLPATYSTPTGYVRYQLKMNDDVDLISDYVCDMEDEDWIQGKLSSGDKYNFEQYLNLTTLEKVINVLERLTGFSDLVTMNNAERALHQAVPEVPHMVYARLIPDIYHYWVSKRQRHHKPCSRKYWPPTSATDTNPHMVFRPREKERYRLRKHRKNDLDSYRKLQQLRREFSGAQSLLQLVIERERLKKADFSVQAEIIEQTIYETNNTTTSAPPRVDPSLLFSYKLQYPQLLLPPPAPVSSRKTGLKLTLKASRGDGEPGVEKERQKPGRKVGSQLKRNRASLGAAGGDATADAAAVAAGTDVKASDVAILTDESNPAMFANALLTGNALYEANTARLIILGIPGPPAFLQPMWPSFMNDLPSREKTPFHTSLADYADELELQRDHGLPTKYRCRGRIGRGGRMIMDRIPVYDTAVNETSRNKYRDGRNMHNTYIFPTSLPSVHEQIRFAQAVRDCKDAKKSTVSSDDVYGAVLADPAQPAVHTPHFQGKQSSSAAAAAAAGGLRSASSVPSAASKTMELYQSSCHPIRDLGLAVPPPRLVQPAELSRREHEIYRMPDSDDELIELPEGYTPGPSFSSFGKLVEQSVFLTCYCLFVMWFCIGFLKIYNILFPLIIVTL